MLYSPTHALRILLRHAWREWRCLHLEWDGNGPCPGCGGNW
jgi:hypothetical protein